MTVIRSGPRKPSTPPRLDGAASARQKSADKSEQRSRVDDDGARFLGNGGKSVALEAPVANKRRATDVRAAASDAPPALTADGKPKWKVPPPGVEVFPNDTGRGDWIEKWQSPKTGKWVHNYTLEYMETRADKKFIENRRFASVLPDVRAQVARDLAKDGSKAQLCALAVALIDKAYFRVGNEESDDNGVYGVTTLLARHVEVKGDGRVDFEYVGKKRVEQHRVVVDKTIAKILKRALAGKQPDDRLLVHKSGGKSDAIDAGDVNRYLEKFGVTAKQFRTFHATRLLRAELEKGGEAREGAREAHVEAAFARVATLLGHTPDVCRQSYVDPTVVDDYLAGKGARRD